MNESQKTNLYIENKGEIKARFKLMARHTSSQNHIEFDMEEGELEVSQRINFLMTFRSSKIGEFQEVFHWELEGSSERLTLLVRGHVRAPKFDFDKEYLDYEKVSYQFEKSEKLLLTNISTVPFSFNMRIPQDGKGNNKEFEIIPESYTIHPNEVKEIEIKVRKWAFRYLSIGVVGSGMMQCEC